MQEVGLQGISKLKCTGIGHAGAKGNDRVHASSILLCITHNT